ncbi:phosphocholine-specific phospholipase C [Microbacterium sp. ASV81]|uniref:phospholipase C n=1 Tax=Microbacterium capsulatum TaxID=3041921 RepID=A0ABU0XD81_9MICO|nr:phospholipase C, phosphocholine-specific [Microbacterium sp. ASV81]MDQ4213076.1 phospholipase C, phosphocholine-specific [Microbacterium sp. ASV81]
MPKLNRRHFMTASAAAIAAAATSQLLGESIARAATIPANRATGTIKDIEHVVVFMQENRAFDTYFGTMNGVRGFADPHPAILPSGASVWHQNDGSRDVLPFHPTAPNLGMQFLEDLDHNWGATHTAFNGGRYDKWLPAKGDATMSFYQKDDIPFHRALANAFTICDQYHCSVLGPTDPNRYYMFTGYTGNDYAGGGPDLWNAEKGYDWSTYPEELEKAGVSWKVYQDVGDPGLVGPNWGWGSNPYIGNYGDTALLYFHQYQNATPGSPLYDKARTGTDALHGDDLFRIFRQDVTNGTLPQVSYIVAPEAYTEHANWPPNYGAWYAANILDILTSNPDVWSKTALLFMYDENDGLFDHVVPPHPNTPKIPGASTVSTDGEWYDGRPTYSRAKGDVSGHYGLGVRVPMIVASPWSMGGWVCSETFDHSSIVRFLENRFGVASPNISQWRRAVSGDLTSAFDFSSTGGTVPSMPATAQYRPPAQDVAGAVKHPNYYPQPPAENTMPTQDPGTRPSRRLGYALDATVSLAAGTLTAQWANQGSLGAHVQVRSNLLSAAPYSYTIGAGASLDASWTLGAEYDVQFHGPAGWYRRYAGTTAAADIRVSVAGDGEAAHARIRIENAGSRAAALTLADAYAGSQSLHLQAGQATTVVVSTNGGWYDLTVTSDADPKLVRTVAGRLEKVKTLTTDPQLGR